MVRSAMSHPQFTLQYYPEADLADLAADYMTTSVPRVDCFGAE
jgi:hypothetical protein